MYSVRERAPAGSRHRFATNCTVICVRSLFFWTINTDSYALTTSSHIRTIGHVTLRTWGDVRVCKSVMFIIYNNKTRIVYIIIINGEENKVQMDKIR